MFRLALGTKGCQKIAIKASLKFIKNAYEQTFGDLKISKFYKIKMICKNVQAFSFEADTQ